MFFLKRYPFYKPTDKTATILAKQMPVIGVWHGFKYVSVKRNTRIFITKIFIRKWASKTLKH